ncbi:MAG: aryl-alcohol dehydrogenase-like predicted oxidoreductase, partial [Myxococcota bacterium]
SESIGVMPYSPLAGGLLTGKYGTTRRPKVGRIIDTSMYSVRYSDQAYFAVAERFTALAEREGISPVTLAIAWVASHPAVTAPLLGARNLEQLTPALAAADFEVSDDLRAEISALSPTPPPATDRNEETGNHNFGSR